MQLVGFVIVSWINVTAPAFPCSAASSRPLTVTSLPREMLSCARIVPLKFDPAPSVAALPTFQKTLQACAPRMNVTLPVPPVMSVEAVWKMKVASALFSPSRTSVPVMPNVPAAEL